MCLNNQLNYDPVNFRHRTLAKFCVKGPHFAKSVALYRPANRPDSVVQLLNMLSFVVQHPVPRRPTNTATDASLDEVLRFCLGQGYALLLP
jgi:hypothetical protein